SNFLDSVIGIDFFSRMSVVKVQGPSNSRRCKTPSVPAPGLKKICPLKAASPSVFTPVPSVLMADGVIIIGPFPVIWNFTTLSNWLLFRVVSAVLYKDRDSRFSVPRSERIEKGAPDCQTSVPPKIQPPITRFKGL